MPSGKVCLKDKKYPARLKQIKNPPETLYFQGDWDQTIFKKCLAVVGTRQMTDYGRRAIEKIVKPIAQAGVTIVSGFMYGCDAAAHRACLEVGGRTIAVLGAGIDLVTPARHKKLKQEVLNKKGLLLSELPGNHSPFKWTFVQRNRIISGLSQAVLVVQAPQGSGALITAEYAQEQKRKLLAVPGQITSSVSWGANKLIKQGAIAVSRPEEALTTLNISPDELEKFKNVKKINLTGEEKELVNILAVQKLSIDKLARELGWPIGQISQVLTKLSLKKVVHQDQGGNYYVD